MLTWPRLLRPLEPAVAIRCRKCSAANDICQMSCGLFAALAPEKIRNTCTNFLCVQNCDMLPFIRNVSSPMLKMHKRPRSQLVVPALPLLSALPCGASSAASRRWLTGPWPAEKTPSPPFELTSSFLAPWRKTPPPFGFSGLGEFVFRTRYARPLPGGGLESWADCCERVVNGTFRMQQRWVARAGVLGWDAGRAQASAQDMFERMFAMKFLPPGRCVRKMP